MMAVVIEIKGKKATIENREWTSRSDALANLLNNWTKSEIEVARIGDPLFAIDSPSEPYPDYAIAKAAADFFDGEIVKADEPPPIDEGVNY